MTIEREADAPAFGLADGFPRPGWVVLDAARDHRFTGELVFEVVPEVRAYLDRGEVYLAERSDDASLGVRLVEAGVLSEAQRERGAMDLGHGEHLGRLFERVPSVDRDTVIVMTEMLNDACVSWLATQPVRSIDATPYRRHVSGVHRWWSTIAGLPVVEAAWPPPAATATPVPICDEPATPDTDVLGRLDDLVRWDGPSWLDRRFVRRPAPPPPAVDATTPPRRDAPATADLIDRLVTGGFPDRSDGPRTLPGSPDTVPVPAPDRFESIRPTGDLDRHLGSLRGAMPIEHSDRDRTGPTVRADLQPLDAPGVTAMREFEHDRGCVRGGRAVPAIDATARVDSTDDVVLAVRRAVAAIETGALDARRRPAADPSGSAGPRIVPPGRSVVTEQARTSFAPRGPSVFDDTARNAPAAAEPEGGVLPPADDTSEPDRVSALRRLIGSMRRR